MKYTSKLPDTKINHPTDSFLWSALKLLVSLAVVVSALYWGMLWAMDYTIEHLSMEQQKRLMDYVKVDFNSSKTRKDPTLDKITQKLIGCANLPYKVETYLLKESEVNAFALPGGKIMVTQGMLKRVKNDKELAFIIGHEMGHFKHNDHLKGMGKSLILALFSMLVSDHYGSVIATTLHVSDAKYSQSQEIDADLFGVDVVACTYGDVKDVTTLFERLDKGERWKYFLSDHPDFYKRVEKMKGHIKEEGYGN